MENTLSQLLLLILTTFIISASSCHKDDPEPDLVPITTTGANTMGFYVDGVPHNKKGSIKAGESSVSWESMRMEKLNLFGEPMDI